MNKIVAWLLCAVLLVAGLTGCSTEKLDGGISQTESSSVQSESSATDTESSKLPEESSQQENSKTEESSKAEDKGDFDIANTSGADQDFSKYEEVEKDKYNTEPVPEGQQEPVEPGDVEINKNNEMTCYLTISCSTILDNMDDLAEGKDVLVPADGSILARTEVVFYEGESVFDVLQRETMNRMIHMESSFTPMYNSAYIEGIGNLYEFDCGSESGWTYCVNGWFPNYGVSRYAVQQGDEIEVLYTCDLGRDL